jgi:RNA polymerase-binding transcription factor DksA
MDAFKRRLEAQRQDLLGQLAELRDAIRAPGDEEETPDEGSLLEGREEALGQTTFVRDELERIDKALARIAEGTYGVSEVSGKPIPRARLEALPTATTLVDEEPPR